MRPSILVVQHEPGAPAGWFGGALESAGCELTLAKPYDGSPLPTLAGHDGLLVLGGSVDSWDDVAAPWLPATRDLVRVAERNAVPTLGICLGHQIAAGALGAAAGRNPAGRTVSIETMGWLPAAAHDRLVAGASGARRALHWNRDVVTELPAGATVLARSDDAAVQAARLGEWVWGIQSHPEVDAVIVADWMGEDWDASDEASRARMAELVVQVQADQEELIGSWRPLADAFAELVRQRHGGTA